MESGRLLTTTELAWPIPASCQPSGFVFHGGQCVAASRQGRSGALLESWRGISAESGIPTAPAGRAKDSGLTPKETHDVIVFSGARNVPPFYLRGAADQCILHCHDLRGSHHD